jgi:hypothetical protein
MPLDLRPKASGARIAPANGVLDRILNWTAFVVCIGLGWWAMELGLWERLTSLLK